MGCYQIFRCTAKIKLYFEVIIMWFDILKKLTGKAKGKGSTLDASRIKINIQDDECNKQLKAWADKIKGMPLILKQRYNENKLIKKHFFVTQDLKKSDVFATMFRLQLKDRGFSLPNAHQYNYLYEHSYYHYVPVPEKVACKAIDMLKKSETGDYGAQDVEGFDEYEIILSNIGEWQDNEVVLEIKKNDLTYVMLGWSNGEDVSAPNEDFKKDFPKGTTRGIFNASGFYAAHEIIYGWWK